MTAARRIREVTSVRYHRNTTADGGGFYRVDFVEGDGGVRLIGLISEDLERVAVIDPTDPESGWWGDFFADELLGAVRARLSDVPGSTAVR